MTWKGETAQEALLWWWLIPVIVSVAGISTALSVVILHRRFTKTDTQEPLVLKEAIPLRESGEGEAPPATLLSRVPIQPGVDEELQLDIYDFMVDFVRAYAKSRKRFERSTFSGSYGSVYIRCYLRSTTDRIDVAYKEVTGFRKNPDAFYSEVNIMKSLKCVSSD